MTYNSQNKSLGFPLLLALLIFFVGYKVASNYPLFGVRASLPSIRKGYHGFVFMESQKLLNEFEAEVTSSSFIEDVIDSKDKYLDIREEFLSNWKPVIVQWGAGRTIVNSVNQIINVMIDVPFEKQDVLYSLREDTYEAIEELLYQYNRKYEKGVHNHQADEK